MKLHDLVLLLCVAAYIFIDVAMIFLAISEQEVIVNEERVWYKEEESYSSEEIWREEVLIDLDIFRTKLKTTPIFYSAAIDEEEYRCLMYAKEPIGRYYITAYNDEETACKITASGARCHEGTVTTCAADVPKYHKFGDILEIDGRLFVVEDTGSAVKKKHIDIFFDSYRDMARYGSNYQTIYRVTFPFGRPKYD